MSFGKFNYKYNSKLYYWNSYNDTIFELDGLDYKAKYLFAKGSYRIKPENNFRSKNRKTWAVSNIFETDKFLFMTYSYNKKNYLTLFDKSANKFFNYYSEEGYEVKIPNDLDAGLSFKIERCNYQKINNTGYLICNINAEDITDYFTSDNFNNAKSSFPKKKKNFEKLANSLNENDNPVLMLVRLKN